MSEQVEEVTCLRKGEICAVERTVDTPALRLKAWPGVLLA